MFIIKSLEYFNIMLYYILIYQSFIRDMIRGVLTGDEEHVSGWDLIYDNGFIEIDPEQCGYTTFLGAAVPQPEGLAYGASAKDSRGGSRR